LSRRHSLIGGLAEPFGRLGIVFWDAPAIGINEPKAELCLGLALIGERPVQRECNGVVAALVGRVRILTRSSVGSARERQHHRGRCDYRSTKRSDKQSHPSPPDNSNRTCPSRAPTGGRRHVSTISEGGEGCPDHRLQRVFDQNEAAAARIET
jgi:hypothetical protein